MKLNKFPVWLMGGIIGAAISLLVSITYLFIIRFVDALFGVGVPTFFLIELPVKIASFIFGWGQVLNGAKVFISLLIFSPVFYFIIGSIIGWIIGKIKKK